MPINPSYPGLYIEEVPSGVRTIMGVATSVTAFIGRTRRGPVNDPQIINSYGDYERIFGGLWEESTLSYAVRDYFLNGGSQAVIIRLFHPRFDNEGDRQTAWNQAMLDGGGAVDAVLNAVTALVDKDKDDAVKTAMDCAASVKGVAAILAATAAAKAALDASKQMTVKELADAALAEVTQIQADASAATAAANVVGASIDGKTSAGDMQSAAETAAQTYTSGSIEGIAADSVLQAVKSGTNVADCKSNRDQILDAIAKEWQAETNAASSVASAASQKATMLGVSPTDVCSVAETEAAKYPAGITLDPNKNITDAAHDGAQRVLAQVKLQRTKQFEGVKSAIQNAKNDIVQNTCKFIAPLTCAQLVCDNLTLQAANDGAWGNFLRARITYESTEIPSSLDGSGLSADDLFTLNLCNLQTGATETFHNVTLKGDSGPCCLKDVLEMSSRLVRFVEKTTEARPAESDTGLSTAQKRVPVFSDMNDLRSTGVKVSGWASDGADLAEEDFTGVGLDDAKQGLYALKRVDLFNLLVLPPPSRNVDLPIDVYKMALAYCCERRAMLIVDAPSAWNDANAIVKDNAKTLTDLNLTGPAARNAALFFPRVKIADPLRSGQVSDFVASGAVAGVFARTDVATGVWKAPAGVDAAINGIVGATVSLNDAENGMLNQVAINCLRTLPLFGTVVWGARTLRGADQMADEYKYIPVRRLALYIEESLVRSLKWVVFEPNDEPLWSQIRLNVGAFMQTLFLQGAFAGKTPQAAYFVKCDRESTTQNDVDRGIVNIVVGFAPLKPAEFVIIKLQQIAGQTN